METAVGIQTGFEVLIKNKWLAIGSEFILWQSIPAALSLQFLQWGVRVFPPRPLSRALVLFRINILWFDWEVYLVGGADEV